MEKKEEKKPKIEVRHPLEDGDILINILSRVPTKKNFQFRCVSPVWRDVLTQPEWTKFLKSNRFILMHNPSAIDPNANRWLGLFCIEIERYNPAAPSDIVFRLPFDLPTREPEFCGSCNGLLCLYGRLTSHLNPRSRFSRNGLFYIFNPLTGEYVCAPQLPILLPKLFFYGFGCASAFNVDCASASEVGCAPAPKVYKIVIAIPDSGQGFQVWVHTLGTDQWRTVATTTVQLPTLDEGDPFFGALEDGTIYWLGSNGVLWGFDVEEETDRVLEIPDPNAFIEGDVDCIVNLGILKQSLCLLVMIRCPNNDANNRIHVLIKRSVVNNERNEVIWKVKLVMQLRFDDLEHSDYTTQPLIFTQKGQMLMFHNGHLSVFTHGRRGLAKVVLHCNAPSFQGAFVHYPTLASLVNAIDGITLEGVRTTRILEYPARSME